MVRTRSSAYYGLHDVHPCPVYLHTKGIDATNNETKFTVLQTAIALNLPSNSVHIRCLFTRKCDEDNRENLTEKGTNAGPLLPL